jgi:Bacterial pullanase-associated domain
MSLRSTLLKAIAVIALALTPVLAAPPDGKIEINYHRCDGNYAKWGVHLWKSPNMPLPDIEWPNPMMPTGTNDFGVYWHADLAEFNTGSKAQVNYIIHKGDIKEQGAKDMKFDGNGHKAIWVVTGDAAIYYSKEEALKGHVCKK